MHLQPTDRPLGRRLMCLHSELADAVRGFPCQSSTFALDHRGDLSKAKAVKVFMVIGGRHEVRQIRSRKWLRL